MANIYTHCMLHYTLRIIQPSNVYDYYAKMPKCRVAKTGRSKTRQDATNMPGRTGALVYQVDGPNVWPGSTIL